MKKSRHGLSLLEAVIVFSMMVALMILVTMFFTRGQRYATSTETYASVQRQATVLLGRVTDEMFRGTRQQMLVGADNDEVAFLSFAPNEPNTADDPAVEFDATTGQLVWKKWVVFNYDLPSKQVRRLETPLATQTSDLSGPVSPEGDFAMFRANSGWRPIGRDVRRFEIHPSVGGVSVSVTVGKEMPVSALTAEQKDVFVNVRMEVNLVN